MKVSNMSKVFHESGHCCFFAFLLNQHTLQLLTHGPTRLLGKTMIQTITFRRGAEDFEGFRLTRFIKKHLAPHVRDYFSFCVCPEFVQGPPD